MPLLRFDIIEGRDPQAIRKLLDAAHGAVVEALEVPERDRYQIVHQHPGSEMVVEDTGLGIERSRDVVVLQVTSRPRGREKKEAFYRLLCQRLEEKCGIRSSDVVVSFVINDDEDWSFGLGRAQFLTKEL